MQLRMLFPAAAEELRQSGKARLSPTSVMASVPKSRGHDSFSLEGEAFGGNLY